MTNETCAPPDEEIQRDLPPVLSRFSLNGEIREMVRFGNGHIHDTIRVDIAMPEREPSLYILQRLNTTVFPNPDLIMANIGRVTEHQRSVMEATGSADIARRALRFLPADDGELLVTDEDGGVWRACPFIERATSHDSVTPVLAQATGRAFGEFMNVLASLDGARLHETIPNFHNTPARYEALQNAVSADAHGRVSTARADIAFVDQRAEKLSRLLDLHAEGRIPERITHNDTKLNNVLIDDVSGEGLCVLDLDTVMPGLAAYDFGDMVRFAANTASEDETDLSRVGLSLPIFESLATGYLAGVAGALTPTEVEVLPFSAWLITVEIGMRFLTDYLDGDAYFKIHREGHNLDRARVQFELAKSMESHEDEMAGCIATLV